MEWGCDPEQCTHIHTTNRILPALLLARSPYLQVFAEPGRHSLTSIISADTRPATRSNWGHVESRSRGHDKSREQERLNFHDPAASIHLIDCSPKWSRRKSWLKRRLLYRQVLLFWVTWSFVHSECKQARVFDFKGCTEDGVGFALWDETHPCPHAGSCQPCGCGDSSIVPPRRHKSATSRTHIWIESHPSLRIYHGSNGLHQVDELFLKWRSELLVNSNHSSDSLLSIMKIR